MILVDLLYKHHKLPSRSTSVHLGFYNFSLNIWYPFSILFFAMFSTVCFFLLLFMSILWLVIQSCFCFCIDIWQNLSKFLVLNVFQRRSYLAFWTFLFRRKCRVRRTKHKLVSSKGFLVSVYTLRDWRVWLSLINCSIASTNSVHNSTGNQNGKYIENHIWFN